MAKVTLYEYDGETRSEWGAQVRWRALCEAEFDNDDCSFDEALDDLEVVKAKVTVARVPKCKFFSCILSWHGPWRNEHGHKCYEAETDDRPLYRAEVEE